MKEQFGQHTAKQYLEYSIKACFKIPKWVFSTMKAGFAFKS